RTRRRRRGPVFLGGVPVTSPAAIRRRRTCCARSRRSSASRSPQASPRRRRPRNSISKQRALIKRLVASAIAGDARSIATLLSFCARAFGDDDDDQQQAPEDHEIVQAFARRSNKRHSKTDNH